MKTFSDEELASVEKEGGKVRRRKSARRKLEAVPDRQPPVEVSISSKEIEAQLVALNAATDSLNAAIAALVPERLTRSETPPNQEMAEATQALKDATVALSRSSTSPPKAAREYKIVRNKRGLIESVRPITT